MSSSTQHDSERQRLLVDALRSISPEEVTAGAFRARNLADVPKSVVRKLIADYPSIRVREDSGKTFYSYVDQANSNQPLQLTDDARE